MDITPEIIAEFRTAMPAFTDDTKWSDTIISEALCEADCETGGKGWGVYGSDCHNFKRRGMFYYAAHWLAITYIQGTAEDPTQVSPVARLNTASKSVGDESINYRVTAMEKTTDDWLTLTNYGVQYMRLRRRAAMGAIAV